MIRYSVQKIPKRKLISLVLHLIGSKYLKISSNIFLYNYSDRSQNKKILNLLKTSKIIIFIKRKYTDPSHLGVVEPSTFMFLCSI